MVWHRPHRVDCPSVPNVNRFPDPHEGQATMSPRASMRMLDMVDLLEAAIERQPLPAL
jgi:hypothetical protein